MIARVLAIAGSDSGGGAGIQADIKTITMLGGHAMTAITAITAQNTVAVTAVEAVPTAMVMAQIDAVIADIGVDAIKIGMLGSAETAFALVARIEDLRDHALKTVPIIFDPVMIATSGADLAGAETIAAFDALCRVATLVTPNLPELDALGGEKRLAGIAEAVLIKGGHASGDTITDRLVIGERTVKQWQAARIHTRSTHGTGCTLASAIACLLAQGHDVPASITLAREFVRAALLAAPGLGSGAGPMGQGAWRGRHHSHAKSI